MFDVQAEPVPNRIGLLAAWLPRIAISLLFLSVGYAKFTDPMWVRLFGRIGIGQWFRYLTGAMQMCGGALVLIPRLSFFAIVMLACTMGGAVIAWLTVLNSPFPAIIPGALFVVLVGIGVSERARSRPANVQPGIDR